jgi:hypothetical protein
MMGITVPPREMKEDKEVEGGLISYALCSAY